MLRESVIQYPTFAARDGQKSAQNGALPCWSCAELENTFPTPPPATKPQISRARPPPIRSGAEKDSNHFTPSTPVRMIATCMAQNTRSEEHTSELQSRQYLVCRLLLDKKN